VNQCLLGEAFRHSAGFGAFRPSVAVTVQRHADNPKLAAAGFKLGGAVASPRASQVGKRHNPIQRSRFRFKSSLLYRRFVLI
jgi:hypothetical protein